MRFRILAALAAASLCVVGVAALAVNAGGAPYHPASVTAGVRYARTHHVHMTAAAAKAMVGYPAATCPNDPFLRRCHPADSPPRYLFASSDLRNPPASLKEYLAGLAAAERHMVNGPNGCIPCGHPGYTQCWQRITELHATHSPYSGQEIAHGHQWCQGAVFWQSAYNRDQEKTQSGQWVWQMKSPVSRKPHTYCFLCNWNGGDGFVYNKAWTWCHSTGWRWQRDWENGSFEFSVPNWGGTRYGWVQMVHRGCESKIQ